MAKSRVCKTAVTGSGGSAAGSAGDSANECGMLAKEGLQLTCTGSVLDSEVFNDEGFLVRCSLPVVEKFA